MAKSALDRSVNRSYFSVPNEAMMMSNSNTLAKFIGRHVRNIFVNNNNFHNAHAMTAALPAAQITVISTLNEA
jgi:hypothetical protein